MAKLQNHISERTPLDGPKDTSESTDLKLHGVICKGKKISRFEQDPYNEYQNFLYNRALFGLGVYTQEEAQLMHWDKKKRIIKVHKRAQTVINLWKQRIVNVLSNHLFKTVFPDSPITKELLEVFGDVTDELHINKMPLKSLKITKEQIVARFIVEGILPKNFNELKPKEGEVIKGKSNVHQKELG